MFSDLKSPTLQPQEMELLPAPEGEPRRREEHLAGKQSPGPFLMPRCCAGFLDPNPRDFSNFKARVRTEEKVKPGSRDPKHVLPWGDG